MPSRAGFYRVGYDLHVIVRPAHDALQLITQPDHAHLAAAIIGHAQALTTRPRRGAILLAVAEHDNGWAEEDAEPILNPATGQLADFINVPVALRHRVWPRAIQRLAHDPWPAALVAEHALIVYDRFRSEEGWESFFTGLEAARDDMIGKSGLTMAELVGDYEFVRLADLISLIFCMGIPHPQRYADWTVRLTGGDVVVTPDLFDHRVIPLEIHARSISNQRFQSDADLRAAVNDADSVIVRGTVSGR
jgi:hypothetical protein